MDSFSTNCVLKLNILQSVMLFVSKQRNQQTHILFFVHCGLTYEGTYH